MVLIDSVYINKGGGKILLICLLDYIIKNNLYFDFYFLFDDRLETKDIIGLERISFTILESNEKSRKIFYTNNSTKYSSFFCFSNVPPPFTIKDKPISIYFHNTLLINCLNANISLKQKLILFIKKIYIKYHNEANYNWVVQTEIIADSIEKEFKIESNKIDVIPFYNENYFKNINLNQDENNINYLYVADGSPQKNHSSLLDAFEKFVKLKKDIPYTLNLTISETSSKSLLNKIKKLQNDGINIINHKECTYQKIRELYKLCNFLIYPSLTESFGLPLIEAAISGCKIISSDLPYVYKIVNPSLVFDPNNVESITNALLLSTINNELKPTKLHVHNNIKKLLKKIQYV
jgi:glycosyltransferase involved in cell wall biosynthesis